MCWRKICIIVLVNLLKVLNAKFVLLHFLFWIAVWFFFVYFFSYNSDNTAYVTWFSSFLLPVTMIITYFVVYFLIPQYLLTKKYLLFALYSFYTLVFSTYLVVLTILLSFVFLSNLKFVNMPPMSRNFAFVLILVYLVVGVVSFISLLNHNFNAVSRNRELENKILDTQLQMKEQELQYLKKQIHPHFLFNTLNTIYGFALKQSKQTPEIILKLSNLLDYILYQVNKPRVSLKEEILHVKEYIELEKIRFQDTLKLSFSFDEINENVQIAPMLLIPFVENAFKHGSLVDGYLKVDISIILINNELKFMIRNTVLHQENALNNIGIGLENSRKRLDLNYNGNYDLQIENKDNYYIVELVIANLKEKNELG